MMYFFAAIFLIFAEIIPTFSFPESVKINWYMECDLWEIISWIFQSYILNIQYMNFIFIKYKTYQQIGDSFIFIRGIKWMMGF